MEVMFWYINIVDIYYIIKTLGDQIGCLYATEMICHYRLSNHLLSFWYLSKNVYNNKGDLYIILYYIIYIYIFLATNKICKLKFFP